MSSPFRSAAGTIARSTSAAMKPHGGATLGSTRPLRLARFGVKVTRVTWIRKNRHQAIDGGSSRKHDDRSAQRSRQARHRRQRRPSHPTATDDGSEALVGVHHAANSRHRAGAFVFRSLALCPHFSQAYRNYAPPFSWSPGVNALAHKRNAAMAPSPSATATIIVHLLLKHRPGTRNPTVRRTLWRLVSLSSCGVAVTIQCSPQSRSVVREAPRMCELAGVRLEAGSGLWRGTEFYLLREAAALVLRRQVRCARVPEAGSRAALHSERACRRRRC
jgi:hypothetical protein